MPSRKQLACFWHFSRGRSVDQVVEVTELGRESVRKLHAAFVLIVAEKQFGDNERMEIGGEGVEVEADEVGFDARSGIALMAQIVFGGSGTSACFAVEARRCFSLACPTER